MKCDRDVKVWLDDELELDLRRFADEDDRKLSAYIRIVLAKHVDNRKRGGEISEGANSPGEGQCPLPNEAEFWRAKYMRAIGK